MQQIRSIDENAMSYRTNDKRLKHKHKKKGYRYGI